MHPNIRVSRNESSVLINIAEARGCAMAVDHELDRCFNYSAPLHILSTK